MSAVLWVAMGGAMGSVMRYGFNAAVTRAFGDNFPWGIMLVNIVGCFAMGLVGAYLMLRSIAPDSARLFLTTGLLGGFTTFSAFAWDSLKLFQQGQPTAAMAYVLASVALSLLAVFLGFMIMRVILA